MTARVLLYYKLHETYNKRSSDYNFMVHSSSTYEFNTYFVQRVSQLLLLVIDDKYNKTNIFHFI